MGQSPDWLQRLHQFLTGIVSNDQMKQYGRQTPDMSGMSFPGTVGQGAEQPTNFLQEILKRLFGGGK
jgi:hypothetical protein